MPVNLSKPTGYALPGTKYRFEIMTEILKVLLFLLMSILDIE